MRRGNFLLAAVVAVATYAALSAFVHRPYGWHRGWGWRHDHCYYNDNRWHEQHRGHHHRSPTDRPERDSLATDDSINIY